MIRLATQTILHFRTLFLPVVLGVAIASTVIVGALIVGDSVRSSLRTIALDRIGDIDRVFIAPRWFDPAIIPEASTPSSSAFAILVQQATAQFDQTLAGSKSTHRSNDMALFGVDEAFWKLSPSRPQKRPSGEQVILNQSLAAVLHVEVGDRITLSLPMQSVVPADSTLGKRDVDTLYLPRWEVIEIVPDAGLARFSLRSDQRPSLNAFVDRQALQKEIGIGNKINTLFSPKQSGLPVDLLPKLAAKLDDVGLRFQTIKKTSGANQETISFAYSMLTTDQMLIGDKMAERILEATKSYGPTPILTYLANGVKKKATGTDTSETVRESVPYSTISAVDSKLIESMLRSSGKGDTTIPNDDWVVVNAWLAKELGIKEGDSLVIDYFLPETVEGEEVEKSTEVKVAAIGPMSEPRVVRKKPIWDDPPTPFNDPEWTPTVPGITDQGSIDEWVTPFPLTRPRQRSDDDYWDAHGLTPKLFISYELGQRLFGSRFGSVTGIRFETIDKATVQSIESQIHNVVVGNLALLGWREIPLREQQLRRSSGTTPFDALFLSLSFFLIAAALLLVVLLFRLSIERRANHWGVMTAVGWTRKQVRRLLLIEGALLAAVGSTIGVLGGLLYAYAMVWLLKNWWLGAITVSFLEYFVSPFSLVMGWIASWMAALAAIFYASRNIKKISIASLLKGRFEEISLALKGSRIKLAGAIVCGVIGIAILLIGRGLQGQAQAGAFVGGGMMFMTSGLLACWYQLQTKRSTQSGIATATALAASNAKRSPTRSILAIGLVAIASFLILSMSLFQASPTEPGLGGFALMAKSQSPIYDEIGNPNTRRDVLGDQADTIKEVDIVSMRLRGGDDASCNNLYQADEPQVLGVSARIKQIDRNNKGESAFAWFQTSSSEGDVKDSPWGALDEVASGDKDSPIPVVLDQNTALWALHLGGYVGEHFSYRFDDQEVWFKTVGVLQNTILQGSLMIGETNFQKAFPSISGYRSFLMKVPQGLSPDSVRKVMENGWQDSGLSVVESTKVLSQLLAVQNTYLSAFQLLGTLGLLLGTIGLGTSQLRSAMERRSELAAMRAIGFTKSRLVWMLTLENAWQLLRGMLIGGISAACATIPSLLGGQPFSGIAGPAMMLLIIVGIGLLASWISALLAMRWPLVQSLRATI